MKQTIRLLIFTAFIILIIGVQFVEASQPFFKQPLTLEFHQQAYDPNTGYAEVVVTMTVPEEEKWCPCTEYRTEIMNTKSLEFITPVDWVVSFEPGGSAERVLYMNLNKGDTSFVLFEFICTYESRRGRASTHPRQYFVAGDTLEIWPSYPANMAVNRKMPPSDPDADTLAPEVLSQEYEILVKLDKKSTLETVSKALGYTPQLDRKGYSKLTLSLSRIIELANEIRFECLFFDPPDWMGRSAKVSDDFQFEYTEPVKDTIPKTVMLAKAVNFPTETEQERMNRLEQQPLTGAPLQTIRVDGERFRRYRGETEFQKVEPIDPDQRAAEVANTMDSINSLPITADLDIGLPLGNPDHLEMARTIVDSLISSEEPGHYFTRTTKGKIKELQDQGIRVILLDTIPHSRSYWPGYNTSEGIHIDDIPQTQGYNTPDKDRTPLNVWNEYFDANWTDRWIVENNPWHPYASCWGRISGWGVWCAGWGENSHHPGPYDAWMGTQMFSESIDLSGYGYVTLETNIWTDIHDLFDNFISAYSYDNSYWFYPTTYDQYTGGWSRESFEIPHNYGELFLQYAFQSNDIPPTKRGAYINEVSVVDYTLYPNLVCYTPNGWDAEIVISNVENTHNDDPVYANQPIYIDWAVINEGEADASSFFVNLFIDNELAETWVLDDLPIGIYGYVHDYAVTLDEGWHTFRLEIDPQMLVHESDDLDNSCERSCIVERPTIYCSGNIYYLDPYPGDTNIVSARNIRVELWDDDPYPIWDDSLGFDITDDYGYFEIGPIDNSDINGTLDIYYKIVPENEACFVTTNPDEDDFFLYQTPNIDDIASGEHIHSYSLDIEYSGPFFIADRIAEANEMWNDLRPQNPVGPVQVVLSADNQQSHYNTGYDYIHIESSDIPTNGWPHTFMTDVIIHEYAHYIEDQYSFFITTYNGDHQWDMQRATPDPAACEGFAHFFPNLYNGNPVNNRFFNDFIDSSWYNSENGEFGTNSIITCSANNYGANCEGAVAGVLWDIYDSNDDDWSTWGIYPNSQNYHGQVPDGIKDTLSDGPDNLLSVLLDKTINGVRPQNINDFRYAWTQDVQIGHRKAMEDIYNEHGIRENCCIGITGNINGDENEIISIDDLLLLVDYMYGQGPPPTCMKETDTNGSGAGPDISDLVYLVTYMFSGGPDLHPCQ